MSRKDSKGMFAAVLGQLGDEREAAVPAIRSSSPHLMKVAAGVRQMQERSEFADKLLRTGEQIVELDPDSILPSSIHDRYDDAYEASAIAEIAESMRERGQIVPGLVRPAGGRADTFQIVYGRRRLAAARQLGVKFKAAIRDLSDEQAVIFQGEENTAREDLSFIEKCAFALAQQEAGFKRETICASLSTGKSHVSEMIKIASLIPRELLKAIGKAPGIGRGRWEEFSGRYARDGGLSKISAIVGEPRFQAASSDDRFMLLHDALSVQDTRENTGEVPRARANAAARSWAPADGSVSVTFRRTGKTATLALKSTNGASFADFIAGQLDELYEAFQKSTNAATGD
jgi:ParB family chromosome partitioning protein